MGHDEQVVVDQIGGMTLIAADSCRATRGHEHVLRAMTLEESPDGVGLVQPDISGAIEDVIAITAQSRDDRGADHRIGARDVHACVTFHGFQAAANFRSSLCADISRMCATVSEPKRRST